MRRREREITDFHEKIEVLQKSKVVRLAMTDGKTPYAVPLNFGLCVEGECLTLYFHCAHAGHKIDLLRQNPAVCFEADSGHELTTGPVACDYSYRFESIIGFGNIEFVTDEAEKMQALDHLMRHQTGQEGPHTYAPAHLRAVTVLRLPVASFTGKRHL